MSRKKIDYFEKKLYLKNKETLEELNKIIFEFGSSDRAMIAFINTYRVNPLQFNLKMI